MPISSSAPWLKYYGDVPHHLDYPHVSIFEQVKTAADKFPNNIAYEFMGKKTTYAEFIARIERTAKAYLAMGIDKGDRVSVCLPNCPQALDSFYALNRIGAVPNMIHPLSAAGEIKFYLNFSKSKAILTLDQFYEKVSSITGELDNPDLKVLVAKIQDELPPHLAVGYALTKARKYPAPPKNGNFVWWSEFMRMGKRLDKALAEKLPDADECAAILYSGGTTGTTKGIMLSNYNFNALALQTIAASGFAPIDGMKMLSVMPIFHGFGLGIGIHTALVGGATCILVPQFSISTYADLLVKKQPNIIPGVPTLFEALLRAEKLENADLGFLRGVFCGGDSLSVELKKKVDAFLKAHNASVQIRQGYGLTECVTASCLTPKDYNRIGSIGVPFPDTYYKIVKPGTTEELEANCEGEICISGPSVMIGYMDNDEETENTLRRHPDARIWMHTGDLGKMDEDGFVFFSQRIKRMIITSGYNV
ncbi:MAG: acyl--CoA ligase, partial [Oscillospiraceae bacterium]|nr:acyl--CoA ligase [Oscillospiraceae bacterium]